ncbi:FAD-dependent oxidoreductase [Saccharopolyspora subtropica]|uniref:FAD-dependent oxidoreductase n=1 Tax=Saccharopolyspora thermophila TaxID=89367 RepID=A0A917K382_9PSEU|nr:FAD-dependent oxidoreductase [Saccharopolyspora subtropica]GGI97242.1 FAD-dependent oxidoreductase [Saccharopolyspora subtropica]
MNVQRTQNVEVLVVGGGLVGLTTALVLRHHGIDVALVEKRATTSPQPKARRFDMRSLEVFREMGLAATVHEAARDLAHHDHMASGRTLAESEQLPLWRPGGGAPMEISPERPCLIAQDVLEPVLRRAAEDTGADVRFRTALTGFEQDADGVLADLHDLAADRRSRVRAAYLVAADGARSPVRAALGIERSGRGAIGDPNVNVYFRADLADVVRGREFNLCQIRHPESPGALALVDGRYRWVFMAPGGEVDRDWPALLRTALGVPAPDLEVLSVLPWQAEMLVADRYSAGRVHLAGDAAHVMPPFAAAGANTGITDAHNLGWKLAAVLSGAATPALLDSYDVERRAAGWFAADQSSRRSQSFGGEPDPTLAHPFVLAADGFQYPAGAFAGGPDEGGEVEPVTDFAPVGRVGARVPHRWLDPDRTVSTVDLGGPGWALLVSDDPQRWQRNGLPAHRLDADFLAPGEALLLRPDDVVAWRGTDPAAPAVVLDELLNP